MIDLAHIRPVEINSPLHVLHGCRGHTDLRTAENGFYKVDIDGAMVTFSFTDLMFIRHRRRFEWPQFGVGVVAGIILTKLTDWLLS